MRIKRQQFLPILASFLFIFWISLFLLAGVTFTHAGMVTYTGCTSYWGQSSCSGSFYPVSIAKNAAGGAPVRVYKIVAKGYIKNNKYRGYARLSWNYSSTSKLVGSYSYCYVTETFDSRYVDLTSTSSKINYTVDLCETCSVYGSGGCSGTPYIKAKFDIYYETINPTVSPSSLSWSSSENGYVKTVSVNPDGARVTNIVISGSGFSIYQNYCNNATSSCNIRIKFYTTNYGDFNGTLKVYFSTGQSKTVSLSASRYGTPSVYPTSISFNNGNIKTISVYPRGYRVTSVSTSGTGFSTYYNGCNNSTSDCTVQIKFYTTSYGTFSGTTRITFSNGTTKTVSLSGSRYGTPSVSTSSLTWTSPEYGFIKTVYVYPRGNRVNNVNLSGTLGFSIYQNTCNGATSDCYIKIKFQPSGWGNYSGSLQISLSGQSSYTLQVSLSGERYGTPTVSPTALTWSKEEVGNNKAVQIDPKGWQVTSINISGSGFSIVNNNCQGTTSSCEVQIKFQTDTRGDYNGTLAVTFENGETKTVSLTGHKRIPFVSPETLRWDSADNGKISQVGVNPDEWHVTNVTISGDTEKFTIVSDGCSGIASPCTIKIRFFSSGTGNYSATLAISFSDGTTKSVTLTAHRIAALINPDSLSWQNVMGTKGVDVITNGNIIDRIELTNTTDFKIANNNCVAGSSNNCHVDVMFSPTVFNGTRNGELQIWFTDGTVKTVSLSGIIKFIIQEGGYTNWSRYGESHSFGVRNLTGTTLKIELISNEAFRFGSGNTPLTCSNGQLCNFDVYFEPPQVNTDYTLNIRFSVLKPDGMWLIKAQQLGEGRINFTVNPNPIVLNSLYTDKTVTVNTGGVNIQSINTPQHITVSSLNCSGLVCTFNVKADEVVNEKIELNLQNGQKLEYTVKTNITEPAGAEPTRLSFSQYNDYKSTYIHISNGKILDLELIGSDSSYFKLDRRCVGSTNTCRVWIQFKPTNGLRPYSAVLKAKTTKGNVNVSLEGFTDTLSMEAPVPCVKGGAPIDRPVGKAFIIIDQAGECKDLR